MTAHDIENVYELTPLQQGMLFHTLYAPDEHVYFEQHSVTLFGAIDPLLFRRAWQLIVDRHAILRSAFHWEGVSKPLQVVFGHVELPFDQQDWRTLSQAEQGRKLENYLAEDRARGFRLDEAPVMRVGLMQLAVDRHQFVLSFHHALLDGWSKGLLTREVSECYAAFARGQTPELPPAKPFSDYIAWLQRQPEWKARAYWTKRLADVASPTNLRMALAPGTPGAASRRTSGPGRACLRLPERLTLGVHTLARQHGVTANTVLLGAWALLLARYSGTDDVVFGTVVSGRPVDLPGVETMIGLFINALPMRVGLDAETTVGTLLAGVQEQHLELRDVEYSSLADVQRWSGIAPGAALFDTLVIYENYPGSTPLDAGGQDPRQMEGFTHSFERTNYPLTLIVMPGRQIAIEALYDQARFDAPAIERLLDHLQMLLEGMVGQPAAALTHLPMLTASERAQLLAEWSQSEAGYPPQLLHDLVRARAHEDPQAVALVFGDEQLTYHALEWQANQVAHRLRECGVRAETLVGLCVERSPRMVVGLLGILKAGGAYVPLDPQYPQERLRYMLEDSQVAVLLTEEALAPRLPACGEQRVLLDRDWPRIAALPGDTPPASDAAPDSLAYVIYTSGSTGKPKGVAMPHRPLMNLIAWQLRQDGFLHRARVMQFAPLSFDVSFQEILSTLCSGGSLVLIPEDVRSDPAALLALAARQHVRRLFLPPVALQQLAMHADEQACEMPLDLREVIVAGEQLKVTAAVRAFFERLPGCTLTNQYGPSETHVVTSHTLTGPPGDWPALPPIGKPIDNTRAHLLDARKNPVPAGVAADLYLGGTCLARGYFRKPDQTANRFVEVAVFDRPAERVYWTGDVVCRLPNGDLQYIGRSDDQVKVRGYRIELGEIEAVLGQHPAVEHCVVAALEDPQDTTRRLAAYVVLHHETAADAASLRTHLRANLPDFMVPSTIQAIEALPMTPSGKVDRKALAALHVPTPGSPADIAPRNEIEALLFKLFEEVLGRPAAGVHDNFFELGGHSLMATRLVSRIRAALDMELPIRSLFECATVASLAQRIEEQLVDEVQRGAPAPDAPAGP